MKYSPFVSFIDKGVIFGVVLLTLISTTVLMSINPNLYPIYFVYIVLAIIIFYIFSKIEFEFFLAFSSHLYFISIILLILPLLLGQVTRGAIRWIPIGSITIQPSEIVRPFLLLFFAKYLTDRELDLKRLVRLVPLVFLPVFLILIQPSLGVAILTIIGFLGVLIATGIKKEYLAVGFLIVVFLLPLLWFLLAPYQKQRISVFLDPSADPYGAGYNSIQSMISVGSGRLFGRGLGEGVQTQLKFLPENHTDFIFAAISEELGFVGATLTLLGLFIIFWRLISIIEKARNIPARAYVVGVFLVLFVETFIHTGMNMGLVPITGVPLPLVSAGGSALLGTMMGLAIAMNAKKSS
jgi:rod shape determining protein RodA